MSTSNNLIITSVTKNYLQEYVAKKETVSNVFVDEVV